MVVGLLPFATLVAAAAGGSAAGGGGGGGKGGDGKDGALSMSASCSTLEGGDRRQESSFRAGWSGGNWLFLGENGGKSG